MYFLGLEVDCVRNRGSYMRKDDRSPWRGEVERDLKESAGCGGGILSARGFVARYHKSPDADLSWSVQYSVLGNGTFAIRRVEVMEPCAYSVAPDLKPHVEGRVENFLVPYEMSGQTREANRRVYLANCAKTPLLTLVPGAAVLEPTKPIVVKDLGGVAELVEGLLLSFAPEVETQKENDPYDYREGIARAAQLYGRRSRDRRVAVA